MGAALLYVMVAAGVAWLCHRLIRPLGIRATAILVLLPLVLTGRALLTGRVYAPIDLPYEAPPLQALATDVGIERAHNPILSDLYAQIIPWKKVVREAWLSGEWPLWNPYVFAGDILAAAGQPAPYDPFLILSFLVPLPQSLTFLASITLFLLALWMFVWLRELRCSEQASLFGAASWMFGSFLVFWLGWPVTHTVGWLPLVMLGVRRVMRGGARGLSILTTAFTLMLLSGHPESAMHVVTVAAIFTIWEIAVAWRPAGTRLLAGRLVTLILAGLIALLLCAIYLLPMLEAIPQTTEHFVRKTMYASADRSVAPSEAAARLAVNVVPFLFGSQQKGLSSEAPPDLLPDSAYAGSLLFPLVIHALWRSRRRERWLFAGLALLGLLAGADAPVVADLLARLPLFDIAINDRLIFVASFALSVLATFGLDAWLTRRDRRRLVYSFTIHALLLGVLIALLWFWMIDSDLSYRYLSGSSLTFLLPLVLGIFVLLATRKRRDAIAILLLLFIGQRALEVGNVYPTLPAKAFYPPVDGFDQLPDDGQPYRIVGLGQTLIPSTAAMYGLEDVRGYQAMTFNRYQETYRLWCRAQPVWFNLVTDLTHPFLSFLNVRFAVAPPGTDPPQGWHVRDATEGMTLLENKGFIPRAIAPSTVHLNMPLDRAAFEMALEQDFSKTSWIWGSSADAAAVTENGPGIVTITAPSMKRRHLVARMEQPGWIVVSETGWKGWKAYEGGRRIPLRNANHAFLALQVGAGEHEIDLVYFPSSFVVGSAISLTTLIGVLLALAMRHRRRRTSSLGC